MRRSRLLPNTMRDKKPLLEKCGELALKYTNSKQGCRVLEYRAAFVQQCSVLLHNPDITPSEALSAIEALIAREEGLSSENKLCIHTPSGYSIKDLWSKYNPPPNDVVIFVTKLKEYFREEVSYQQNKSYFTL